MPKNGSGCQPKKKAKTYQQLLSAFRIHNKKKNSAYYREKKNVLTNVM